MALDERIASLRYEIAGRSPAESAEGRPAFFELHDAVVRRAGKVILSVDAFSLACGEHVALLGPNGAGKSTFVSLVTREVLPLHRNEAPVRFMGSSNATLAQIKKLVGVVSPTMQNRISLHLPVLDVVVGALYGTLGNPRHVVPTVQDKHHAHQALALMDIDDLSARDLTTLSTGQRRRVLIARALVHQPRALVLDEPCMGLDPEGMHYVRSSLRSLAQSGISLVLVTHYPEDIVPEIERIVLLKNGRICADGPKKHLLTSQTMSDLFETPLRVVRFGMRDAYYTLTSEY